MTAIEAKNEALWNDLHGDIKYYIKKAVERGNRYVKIDSRYLTTEAIYNLQELGYYIYNNKSTNSHEIRW